MNRTEAAAALGLREEAAAALGLRENEIADVEDSPAGPVIETTDGVRYVIVPEDQPDADGDHGIMFLAAPNEMGGSWPIKVYAQPGAVDTEVDTAPDGDAPVDEAETVAAQASDTEPVDIEVDTAPAKGKGRGNR